MTPLNRKGLVMRAAPEKGAALLSARQGTASLHSEGLTTAVADFQRPVRLNPSKSATVGLLCAPSLIDLDPARRPVECFEAVVEWWRESQSPTSLSVGRGDWIDAR